MVRPDRAGKYGTQEHTGNDYFCFHVIPSIS
jgi:hypothetical protein